MEPGFATAGIIGVIGVIFSVAPIGWKDHPRVVVSCRVVTVLCVFVAAAFVGFAILGLMGMEGIRRASICFGIALVAFGFSWPYLAQRFGIQEDSRAPIKFRLANMNVVSQPLPSGQFLLGTFLTFINDEDDPVRVTDYSVSKYTPSGNDAANIEEIKRGVAEWVKEGGNAPYDVAPHEQASFQVSHAPIVAAWHNDLMSGRGTFYFALTVLITKGKQSEERRICASSTGPNLNIIKMCPAE